METLLKKINFDSYYIEATFQFNLLMELASIYNRSIIFPERSIEYYDNLSNLTKKRIDIVLEYNNNIAIELKMPMNGQVPVQMFKIIQDIKFLEELKSSKKFFECYSIVVTNDKKFWCGKTKDGIYSYFRDNKTITGKIDKPIDANKTEKPPCEINGKYEIQWKNLNDDFRYFIIEI
ncbi:MAG: hypothetical protein LBI18_07050 [Planctomycetaceae bacterium]|nr:hypothetical protein [Planctomycetaceae bacterium]